MSFAVNTILDLSAFLGLYDRWADRHLTAVHQMLAELADLHGPDNVLDVGCGTGRLAARLARGSPGIKVHGIDVGTRMIAVARKRIEPHHQNLDFQVGTVARLPFSDGQFDVVLSCLLLHLLSASEQAMALREIFRVLKRGGRYVCAEFETYPAGFPGRRLLAYPRDLIESIGFHVDVESPGPSITKKRPVRYRVLAKSTSRDATDQDV